MFLNKTVSGEPSRVRVEAVNSSCILVHWRPPTDQKFGLLGYHVYYYPTLPDDVDSDFSFTSLAPAILLKIDEPTTNKVFIDHLPPSTPYAVQVAAVTKTGVGQLSKAKKIKTKNLGRSNQTFLFIENDKVKD